MAMVYDLSTVRHLEQCRQVVEADGDFGMVWPEVRFVDGKRPAIKRLRLRVVGSRMQKHSELIC